MNELDIFSSALEIESLEERERYLERQCGDDSELRSRIEQLLHSYDDAGSFMDVPAPEATVDFGSSEQPGAAIGPYKLLQVIGEGGMGVVYMAEQSHPVTRRVALKIIKPGMDTAQIIARFEAERQALAMMDHPNIAKVFDAGATEAGRPFFVMELVKGIPISDYCDEQHFTPKERLELFVKVCHAVQHAHQKGVIHRDLKPTNVLVAEYDQQAVPKIIDFGVAKATSQKLTEKTMFTQYGQIVGTLEYMSPEQAKLNQLDIDTRSDVYSLGVLLYQLLTGTTPFERGRLQSAAFEEMLRIIREEEPPKPSTRISTLGKSAAALSGYRRTNTQKLHQVVRGELDWIVMKALEKERSRRYESASGFAADVQRFLTGEAVSACPPSRAYRMRKFVRRNWAPLAATSVLLLSLCLGLIGTMFGLAEARAEKRAADLAREEETVAREDADLQRLLAVEKQHEAEEQRAIASRERDEADAQREKAERQRNKVRENLYYAQMNGAGRAAQEVDGLGRVADILKEWSNSDPDYRGWEWHFLDAVSHREIFSLEGHQETVCSVAWSPDQKFIATASDDQTVRVWDALTRRSVFSLDQHRGPVFCVAWSPDGSRLATASQDMTVRIWDVATRSQIRMLSGHKYPVTSVAWSPDGKQLASTDGLSAWATTGERKFDDAAIMIWNAETGTLERTLMGHTAPIRAVCWSPDGSQIASAAGGWLPNEDCSVRVWDSGTGQPLRKFERAYSRVSSVCWSADGRWLAWVAGLTWGVLEVWEVGSESEPLEFEVSGVHSLCWSPDSTRLASTGADRVIRVLDLTTEREIVTLRSRDEVQTISWSGDGKLLASGNAGGSVRVWNANTEPEVLEFAGPDPMRTWDFDFSPDGTKIVSAGGNGKLAKWDAATGELLQDVDARALSPNWSHNGQMLAVARGDGTLSVCDAATLERLFDLPGHATTIWKVRWSPDDSQLATASRDKTVGIWDVRDRGLVCKLPHSDGPVTVSWSPDGERVASGAWDGEVRVWDVAAREQLYSPLIYDGGAVRAVHWSPDGRSLAAAGRGGRISVWNAMSGDLVRTLTHTGHVSSVAWSPGSERLASVGFNGRTIIWNAATGHEALTLLTTIPRTEAVRWSPDGKRLAVGGGDGGQDQPTIKLWDATPGYARETQRRQSADPLQAELSQR